MTVAKIYEWEDAPDAGSVVMSLTSGRKFKREWGGPVWYEIGCEDDYVRYSWDVLLHQEGRLLLMRDIVVGTELLSEELGELPVGAVVSKTVENTKYVEQPFIKIGDERWLRVWVDGAVGPYTMAEVAGYSLTVRWLPDA